MSEEFNLERIREIIDAFDRDEFYTADVIREYFGSFRSDREIPAGSSRNAQFGKCLKRNRRTLGIMEVRPKVPIEDDDGHPTSSSLWRRVK